MENKGLLNWIGEHPILTIVLVSMVFEGTTKIINSIKGGNKNEHIKKY
jgi:hypothetical protein